MINTIIALLVEVGLLKPEEGELLVDKVRKGTLPADYASSHKQVVQWLKDVRAGK